MFFNCTLDFTLPVSKYTEIFHLWGLLHFLISLFKLRWTSAGCYPRTTASHISLSHPVVVFIPNEKGFPTMNGGKPTSAKLVHTQEQIHLDSQMKAHGVHQKRLQLPQL